jgi:hypothetical protein
MTSACRAPLAEPVVPSSWLVAGDGDGQLTPAEAKKLGNAFDQLAMSNANALESLPDPAASNCPEHWHLGGYFMNFAVTVNGILGALVGAGTSIAELHWLPVGQKAPEAPRVAGIHLRANATPEQLQRQLEPAVQAALASGLIRSEARLRSNLLDAAQSFQAVAGTLDALKLRGARWTPNKFRLELTFGADGELMSLASAGAMAMIRFDWDRRADSVLSTPTIAPISGGAAGPGQRLAERVGAFVRAVSQDLDVLDGDAAAIEGQGMKLEVIRIGAGFTASGDAGIAEAYTQLVGSFEFGRQNGDGKELALADAASTEDTIDMIAGPAALAADGLRAATLRDGAGGGQDTSVAKLPRAKFRRGLARANRIASFLARHAASLRVGKWAISEMSTEFDLSLAGSIGIATVGGTGVVGLVYANPIF